MYRIASDASTRLHLAQLFFVLTSHKPREKKETTEPLSSYKDQLGFGLHVVVTMLTGYLVGYAAFRALFNQSPVMHAAGGILGLVIGMLVETFVLFHFEAKEESVDLVFRGSYTYVEGFIDSPIWRPK
ncbi:unnamed protein product [Malus baccata var. baccata]